MIKAFMVVVALLFTSNAYAFDMSKLSNEKQLSMLNMMEDKRTNKILHLRYIESECLNYKEASDDIVALHVGLAKDYNVNIVDVLDVLDEPYLEALKIIDSKISKANACADVMTNYMRKYRGVQ